MNDALDRAKLALEGLSVGDAFGEQFLHAGPATRAEIYGRRLTPGGARWQWTDDTAMALSIVEVLAARGTVDPNELAAAFARRYAVDPGRGYGGGAHQVLAELVSGTSYEVAARALFHGQGSCGNGGAMRAAPVGAYFAGDPKRAADEARKSAQVTHAHAEGQAGAIAIAVAAAFVGVRPFPSGRDLLTETIAHVPPGPTREGIATAASLDPSDVSGVFTNRRGRCITRLASPGRNSLGPPSS